jgi:hypothetical protein
MDYLLGLFSSSTIFQVQARWITVVLGLTGMATVMDTQEEEILEEEDNDGEMNDQSNAT